MTWIGTASTFKCFRSHTVTVWSTRYRWSRGLLSRPKRKVRRSKSLLESTEHDHGEASPNHSGGNPARRILEAHGDQPVPAGQGNRCAGSADRRDRRWKAFRYG